MGVERLSIATRRTTAVAICGALAAGGEVFAQTVGPVGVSPGVVPVGIGTPVTVTAAITDPAVIPSSVQLQRHDSQGRVLAVLGALTDDL